MNPDLKQSRIDLACALRWAARLNLHEGVDNHFSLAVPDEDGVMRGKISSSIHMAGIGLKLPPLL